MPPDGAAPIVRRGGGQSWRSPLLPSRSSSLWPRSPCCMGRHSASAAVSVRRIFSGPAGRLFRPGSVSPPFRSFVFGPQFPGRRIGPSFFLPCCCSSRAVVALGLGGLYWSPWSRRGLQALDPGARAHETAETGAGPVTRRRASGEHDELGSRHPSPSRGEPMGGRDARPHQAVRAERRSERRGAARTPRLRLRLPGAERRRQDDTHPGAARIDPRRRRHDVVARLSGPEAPRPCFGPGRGHRGRTPVPRPSHREGEPRTAGQRA